jgi:HlyD family secretion protein
MDKLIERTWIQKNKKYLPYLLVLFIAVASYSFYINSGLKTISVTGDNISTYIVKNGDFEEYINISGKVQPKRTIQLVALEGGIVESINFEDGDLIENNIEILKLSNQSLQLDLINKETALLDQLNNLRISRMSIDQNYYRSYENYINTDLEFSKSKRKYDENKNLIENDYISNNEYQESLELYYSLLKKSTLAKKTLENDSLFRISQISQLNFSMNLIEDNLELVKKTMNNLSISAPFSGQLTNFNFELGQNVEKGSKIGEIDLKKGYLIRAEIDEHYISRIENELKGKFEFNGNSYNLIVKKVYPNVKNGMFEVDLVAEQSFPSEIKLGQTSYVKLSLGKPKKSLLLKKGPFFQKTGGRWVFVTNENGVSEKRSITLGKQNPNYYEVLSGLNINDEVIISDYNLFGDAEKVSVLN